MGKYKHDRIEQLGRAWWRYHGSFVELFDVYVVSWYLDDRYAQYVDCYDEQFLPTDGSKRVNISNSYILSYITAMALIMWSWWVNLLCFLGTLFWGKIKKKNKKKKHY